MFLSFLSLCSVLLLEEIPKPKPIYTLSLSATIAPQPAKTPIPLVPVRLAIIYRSPTPSFLAGANLQKEAEPIETYALSEKNLEIPSGTKIPLPFYNDSETVTGLPPDHKSRASLYTYLRLSGQNVFNDNGFLSEQTLIDDQHCTIEETQSTCQLRIPSVQVLGADAPTTKIMELKIFRKGSVVKSNFTQTGTSFLPLSPGESFEEYIKKFSRPDLSDPERKNISTLTDQDLLESKGTLKGYFLYSKMIFSADLQETDVPVEVKEPGRLWKVFQYSKSQSVGRIALLPDFYLIERTLETIDAEGNSQSKTEQAVVDLSKWDVFVPAEKLVWTQVH